MATALPKASRNQSPDEHMQISRRFIEHAREELDKGERLQASEKVWGAAGHAISAVGKERGWLTGQNEHKEQIALQLALEFEDPSIATRFTTTYRDQAHGNFHRNDISSIDAINNHIADVERFIEELQGFRETGPQPFTVISSESAARIFALSGQSVKVGQTYTNGFVNQRRLARYQRQWQERQNLDNDDEAGRGSEGGNLNGY